MSDPHNRDVRIISSPDTTAEKRRGRNIIAVIGIDKYQNLQLLHNAVSDAQGVRALFVDQLGFQELTPPLYDEQATRNAITALIVDRLNNQLEPEDSLVFFFAGHGYTETRTVGTRTQQRGYLIPVEGAAPDARKFSTYLRLDSLLEEVASLPAMHILVILDACHSGFALGDSVQVLRDTQRYSDDLSKRMSRRVIASAMSAQPALDNGPVSGHSLFTGTVVEALAGGKADADNKGFVTSSEIALYVQRKVASWSNSQQTPDFGSFELDDRGELVISLVGETQSRLLAQESLTVGDYIMELGWLTHDPKRYAFAATQYRAALRHALLGKVELIAAELGLVRALLAAGEIGDGIDDALKVLTELVARTTPDEPIDAQLYLGAAHLMRGDDTAAQPHLMQYLANLPAAEKASSEQQITNFKNQLQAAPQPLRDSPFVTEILLPGQHVGQRTLVEVADFLSMEVGKREARNELWPEGRLQLGITFAALKEYRLAEQTLDEVIRICESGGRYTEEALAAF